MTLRAMLRENQRQTNQSHPTLSAGIAERGRRSHLHLIRRDGRGGLFLPSSARWVPMSGRAANTIHAITNPISQKGNVA